MTNLCVCHPTALSCQHCGRTMGRELERICIAPQAPTLIATAARIQALREAREIIKKNAMSCWRAGLEERSDAITEVLVDFDREFPEVLEP